MLPARTAAVDLILAFRSTAAAHENPPTLVHALMRRAAQELCPLSPGTDLPVPDTMVVFRMDEVDRSGAHAWGTPPVAFEREVFLADALPKGSNYVLQYVNCENVGNYTYGANGTALSAVSLTLEVRSGPAFSVCRSRRNTCAAQCRCHYQDPVPRTVSSASVGMFERLQSLCTSGGAKHCANKSRV